MDLAAEILAGLKAQFNFKKPEGEWMQGGTCPACGQREVYCHSVDPKIVKCGRVDRCGWEDSVRNLLPELFEDWSKRAPATRENPTASADAYLVHERGLNPKYLAGLYTQETYRDYDSGEISATVRFTIGETYWERIIDKPGRFDRKAHFGKGGKWRGRVWIPKTVTIEHIARADQIWITEGIFDTTALTQAGLVSVSNMSTNPYPEIFLDELRAECERLGLKTRPQLVFAFDVGAAGVKYSRKHIERARSEGWDATAAQVRPDGDGIKLDWNDLWLRHEKWKGDASKAPLGSEALAQYLHNGALITAQNQYEKAKLIVDWQQSHARSLSSFDMRFDNRIFWVRVTRNDEGERDISVVEICNCAFRLLYRERDEIQDETHYFLQIDFPFESDQVKARFSHSALANTGEFKKRLLAFAGTWTGTGEQLDRIIKAQTRRLKVVEPIPFTGYSKRHEAWLLGDLAIHKGRVQKLNTEKYFDVGKRAVKLRTSERILEIDYKPDRLSDNWLRDLWIAYGPRGLIALAFFVMSLFAVQIRDKHKSLGFLEITGPPGSGKTTLIEFLWKLLGRSNYEGFDPSQATQSFLSRSLVKVSNLPVGLIESERQESERKHSRLFEPNDLLVLYNGRSPRGLGKKTGGFETEEPPFLGSIYLMQNERIHAEAAVLSRLMSMQVDKSRWSPETRIAARRLENWPIEEISGTHVHIVRNESHWLKDFLTAFERHDREMESRVEGLREARPIKCHSQLAAALETLPNLFSSCERPWVDETLAEVDRMALDRQNSIGSDDALIADFWEKVEYLLSRELHDAVENGNSLNRHRSPEKYIAINLPHFEARCRSAGLIAPPMDKLKKRLRGSKSRKFHSCKPINSIDGKTQACWIFEQPHELAGPVL